MGSLKWLISFLCHYRSFLLAWNPSICIRELHAILKLECIHKLQYIRNRKNRTGDLGSCNFPTSHSQISSSIYRPLGTSDPSSHEKDIRNHRNLFICPLLSRRIRSENESTRGFSDSLPSWRTDTKTNAFLCISSVFWKSHFR